VNFVFSGSSEGAGFCLMAVDSASEGYANFSGPDTSAPATTSEDLGALMPPKMAVGQGEHVDVGFLKRGFLKSPMVYGAVPIFVASVDPNQDPPPSRSVFHPTLFPGVGRAFSWKFLLLLLLLQVLSLCRPDLVLLLWNLINMKTRTSFWRMGLPLRFQIVILRKNLSNQGR